MLPKNKMGGQMITKLKVYRGRQASARGAEAAKSWSAWRKVRFKLAASGSVVEDSAVKRSGIR